MTRKINLIYVVAIFAMVSSCKKESASEETDLSPTGIEAAAMPTAEEAAKIVTPEPPVDGKYPAMTFAEKEHNFGEIKQGDKVEHVFTFKNTGEADLIITNAQASCGCTVPEYPKEAVKPGESGKIMVSFDSTGKSGETHKTITVSCNTESGNELLTIKTTIKAPGKGA
jgi:hypothetical protein